MAYLNKEQLLEEKESLLKKISIFEMRNDKAVVERLKNQLETIEGKLQYLEMKEQPEPQQKESKRDPVLDNLYRQLELEMTPKMKLINAGRMDDLGSMTVLNKIWKKITSRELLTKKGLGIEDINEYRPESIKLFACMIGEGEEETSE